MAKAVLRRKASGGRRNYTDFYAVNEVYRYDVLSCLSVVQSGVGGVINKILVAAMRSRVEPTQSFECNRFYAETSITKQPFAHRAFYQLIFGLNT